MKIPTRALALATLVVVAACDDSTGPRDGVPLSLSVTVAPAASGAAQASSLPLAFSRTFSVGTDELVIDYVGIVLDEVELESILDDECDDTDGDGMEGNDDCEEFEAGPFLVELPLTEGTVVEVTGIMVSPGTYDELEFDIDDPDDDDGADLDFVTAHPEFEDISIRVEGTFNGTPFVYTSTLDAEQEMALSPPLEVTEGMGPVNMTMEADISGWFLDGQGNLVDPATANADGPNEELVENNIQRSLNVFEDDDHDGEDDHESGD